MAVVHPFRANAAFSLYGFLKNDWHLPGRGKCRKATYINTFFTYEGASSILLAVGKSVSVSALAGDDYYGYVSASAGCYGIEYDYATTESKTLGCTADGDFAIAKFQGSNCEGRYFLDTTQDDDISEYNHAMDSLNCRQIYKSKKQDTTIVQTILSTSFACDIALYGTHCPDPYNLKRKYDTNTILSSRMGRSVVAGRWQTRLRILTIVFCVAAAMLCMLICFVENPRLQRKIQKLAKKRRKEVNVEEIGGLGNSNKKELSCYCRHCNGSTKCTIYFPKLF